MSSADTERRYRRIARFYDFLDRPFERKRYQPLRPALFEGLSGRILDTGIGTGCNMPFYPGGAVILLHTTPREMHVMPAPDPVESAAPANGDDGVVELGLKP